MILKQGERIDNYRLVELFQCSPQGGMRFSKKSNTLVLVSNHVQSIYDDKWINNVLHYTGMGQEGDQKLDFRFNKHLSESNNSNISIHLLEVFEKGVYTYQGEVELESSPYRDYQLDALNKRRLVWIFPLALKSGKAPFISEEDIIHFEKAKQKITRRISNEKLKNLAENSKGVPSKRPVETKKVVRDPYVVEYALRRAKSSCQLCNKVAPFLRKDGSPYLEVHHIHFLRDGGSDSVNNVVALCPNCHRKMHVVAKNEDVTVLKEKAKELLE